MKKLLNPSGRQSGFLAVLIWTFAASIFLSVPIFIFSGLISGWGQWYSPEVQIRQQSDALLSGRIALETDPGFVEFNYLWDNGKVQQIWGLGVAAWRLPFEAVAGAIGASGFPDRIAFLIALLLAAFLAIRVLLIPHKVDGLPELRSHIWNHPESVVAVFLLILFPPFLSLLFGIFSVYEEIQAYSYLAAVCLFLGAIAFCRNPSRTTFFVVAFLAGIVPIVRPTLGVYGLASICIMLTRGRLLDRCGRTLTIGALLFMAGGGVVITTNGHRFGSVMEFGHSLNLNPDSSMRYISRFDNPYRGEPIGSALGELGAWLFFMDQKEYDQRYGRGAGPAIGGEVSSERFRYRRLNAFTFGPTYLVPLIGIVIGAAIMCILRWRKKVRFTDSEFAAIVLWCCVSIIPLVLFYLWFPVLYARYLLDFAPALVAGLLALVYLAKHLGAIRFGVPLRYLLLIVLVFWWGYQLRLSILDETSRRASRGKTLTAVELAERMERSGYGQKSIPGIYELGMDFEEYANQYNGSGWRSVSGDTGAAITLFVEDPEFLELTVAPVSGEELSLEDYEIVRAKVALEFLELESMTPTEEGMILRFSGPKRKRYQSGVQVVFVAFKPVDELHEGWSRFRLLRVRWREEGKSMNYEG